MPQPPLFSILLPTHNRADVLELAIRSVRAQTVTDFELLVLGDGCTDDTGRIVAAIMEQDPRVRWFDLPKAPHYGYANNNRALAEARGELIAYMAHDDLWLPDHLELLLPFMEDERTEIAYSRPLWVSPQGHVFPLSFNLHDPEVLDDYVSGERNSIPAACFIYRRRCIERDGGWDESLPDAADWDLYARILKGGGRDNFAYLPTPTCLHFQAIWKTEANPGPADYFTWRHRTEGDEARTVYQLDTGNYPTEQAAFAARLEAGGVAFSREIRMQSQRMLDRLAMESDLAPVQLIHQVREQEARIQKLCSEMGVLEYTTPEPGTTVIFGQGCYPDEQGSRWLWRRARMLVLADAGPTRISLTLHCGKADDYEAFPLTVEVSANGAVVAMQKFKSSGKKQKVDFMLDGHVNEIEVNSSSAFIPGESGINDDQRELSLRMSGMKVKTSAKGRADSLSRLVTRGRA